MTKRCGTCANFTRYSDGFSARYHGPHAGECTCDKFRYESGVLGADELHYWDYESYSAGFAVGDQFGCVHWRAS